MRLVEGVVYTEATGELGEMEDARQALRVFDPAAYQDPNFMSGLWDGHRSLIDEQGRILTGLMPFVEPLLRANGIDFDIKRQAPGTFDTISPDLLPGITLRDYQLKGIQKFVYHKRGLIVIPGGGGKTEICVAVHAHLQEQNPDLRTLVVVNRTKLADQTVRRFKKYDFDDVCVLGGGKARKGYQTSVVVALIQSLSNGLKKGNQAVIDLLEAVDLVIFDETHHLGANTWAQVGQTCEAEYRLGLSATPFEESMIPTTYRDLLLMGILGPVRLFMDTNSLVSRGVLAKPVVMMLGHPSTAVRTYEYHEVYSQGIVEAVPRNHLALATAWRLYERGFKVLMLVQRIEHGKQLIRTLAEQGYEDPIFSFGGGKNFTVDGEGDAVPSSMKEDAVFSFLDDSDRYIFVGSSVYDQGIDIPSLNAVIILSGGKKLRPTLQRAYRAMRPKPTDVGNVAYIFDFFDQHHVFLRKQSEDRIALYRQMDFEIFEGSEAFFRLDEVVGPMLPEKN